MGSNLATSYVDLTVDEHFRPHIAYLDGKRSEIKYATWW
jgi:hypothetical protein